MKQKYLPSPVLFHLYMYKCGHSCTSQFSCSLCWLLVMEMMSQDLAQPLVGHNGRAEIEYNPHAA